MKETYSTRRKNTFRSWIGVLTLSLLASAAPPAQAPPPGVPDLKALSALAKMPEANQRDKVAQTSLTAWFLHRVEAFQGILSGYAVGSTVNLGDFAAYRKRMALMGGAPDWVVIFEKGRKAPQKEPGEPFYFPDNNLAGFVNPANLVEWSTCWHEFQHGLLGDHSISVAPYGDEHAEHVYIELFAERTVGWMWYLNRDQKFEALAREAFNNEEAYRSRGATITLEIERNLWAKANKAWQLAWNGPATPIPIALSGALRQEYHGFTGVSLPSVEEVIKFYMQGGIKGPGGRPIQVPEWVMNPDPILAIAALDYSPKSSTGAVKAGILEHRFQFMPRGLGRDVHGNRKYDPISRGRLTVQLDTDEDGATLNVSLGGRPLSGISGPGGPSLRRYVIDLPSLAPDLAKGAPFEVKFIHRHPEQISGTKTFQISVEYTDPADSSGMRVYHPSKALFWVDVTGPATAAKAAGSTAGGAKESGTKGSAAGPGGRWVLEKRTIDGEGPAPEANSTDTYWSRKATSSYADGSFSAKGGRTPFRERDKNDPHNHQTSVTITWSAPKSFRPGETIGIDLNLKTSHTVLHDKDPKKENRGGALAEVWIRFGSDINDGKPGRKPRRGPFYEPPEPWLWWDSGQHVAIAKYNESKRVSIVLPSDPKVVYYEGNDITLEIEAAAGDFAIFSAKKRGIVQGWGWVTSTYVYAWEDGTGAAPPPPAQPPQPGEVKSEVRHDPPSLPPEDKRADNVPPENGEVNPIKPEKGAPKPKESVKKPEWYTHAEGFYRFRPVPGWHLLDETPVKDLDCLGQNPNQVFYLLCNRSHSEPEDSVAAAHRLADEQAASNKARRRDFMVGGSPGSWIGYPAGHKGTPIVLFHIYLAHKKHVFYIAAWVPRDFGLDALPGPIREMLDTLEYLK